MSKIATICARGGSVGVPGKNIRELCGKPLIVHSIEHAKAVNEIENVFVSTDCPEIASIASNAGAIVPFLRPAHLATHDASKLDALEHLVDWVEENHSHVSVVVDLQPTSPLRVASDIVAAMSKLDDSTDLVITGYHAEKNPYFDMVECDSDGRARLVKSVEGQIVARQHAPDVFSMNGSIYVWRRDCLMKGVWPNQPKLHVMPRERSIDIDEPIDFEIAEMIMKRQITSMT